MKHIYIHIGLFKTATTLLQEDVFPNLPGFFYIPKKLYRHTLLKSMLFSDYLVFRQKAGRVKEGFLELMGDHENIILSHEIFSGNPYFQAFDRYVLLNKLHLMFPDAKIIFAFRGQKYIIDSLYREYVVQGGIKRFQDFALNKKNLPKSILSYDPHLDLEVFKYGPYIDFIHELYGTQNIFIFPYESLKMDFNAWLGQLANFLGIQKEAITPPSSIRREGLGDLQIGILRIANRIFRSAMNQRGIVGYRQRFSDFLRHTNKVYDKRTLFPDRYELGVNYQQDNDYLEEKYGFPLRREYAWAYYS